jgi:dihydroneopterin triphosphate diphosphatase
MARAPFQVLVIPYRVGGDGRLEFALFRRADLGVWQGIAGGGEEGESPETAARREAWEEAGIPATAPLRRLASIAAIPTSHFAAAARWDPSITEIPEHAFGVAAPGGIVRLSSEHTAVAWSSYQEAIGRCEWESNRAALRELHDLLIAEGEGSR